MDDQTRRVGEIESEIDDTRAELSETIEAIQERLTPANIAANARDTVKDAATEKVRQMADNPFIDTIRDNPIPAAMIGLGAAWLLLKGRPDSGRNRDSRAWRDGYPRNVERYRAGIYDEGSYGSAVSPVGTSGRSAYGSGAGVDEGLGSRIGDAGRDLADRTREMAGDVRDTARQTTRRAQVKFDDVLRDNPLMLGAAAVLVGAAIGATVPATETENRLMGEARDAVVDRAQNVASEAANRVSEAAGNVKDLAGKVADEASDVASSTSSRPRRSKT